MNVNFNFSSCSYFILQYLLLMKRVLVLAHILCYRVLPLTTNSLFITGVLQARYTKKATKQNIKNTSLMLTFASSRLYSFLWHTFSSRAYKSCQQIMCFIVYIELRCDRYVWAILGVYELICLVDVTSSHWAAQHVHITDWLCAAVENL